MANYFKNPEMFEEGIEQATKGTVKQVTQATKAAAATAAKQVTDSWTAFLTGSDDTSAPDQGGSNQAQANKPQIPQQRQDHQGETADTGIEDLNPHKQQGRITNPKHQKHHMMQYWEVLFGEARRRRIQQEEEQQKQMEQQEEEQDKMEEIQVKKQNDQNLAQTRARTKAETGVGNAGG